MSVIVDMRGPSWQVVLASAGSALNYNDAWAVGQAGAARRVGEASGALARALPFIAFTSNVVEEGDR